MLLFSADRSSNLLIVINRKKSRPLSPSERPYTGMMEDLLKSHQCIFIKHAFKEPAVAGGPRLLTNVDKYGQINHVLESKENLH